MSYGLVCYSCCICLTLFSIAYALFYKYGNFENETASRVFDSLDSIIFSPSSQLEFLTLLGIIMNAFLQSWVSVNSIYIYVIENLHKNLKSTVDVDVDPSNVNLVYDIHGKRIHNVLEQISTLKKKQLKL